MPNNNSAVFVPMKVVVFLFLFALALNACADGGVPLWTNRYEYGCDCYGGSWNARMAVDNDGNVLITGLSMSQNDLDYATIKHSSAGIPLWTNRFGGPTRNDLPVALTMDTVGNVFVTGSSSSPTNGFDYATVKYSSTGLALWTNRYSGAGKGDDYPIGIAVDGNGNLFVTGSSPPSSATIAYSNTGVPLWTNRDGITGPIAVDANGNVFLTGAADFDLVTVKYSNGGLPLWTNHYNGGPDTWWGYVSGIAVDSNGNVFLTGALIQSATNDDYVTIAYSNSGALLWTNRYGAPDYCDRPQDIALDSGGNVFVTGYSGHGGAGETYVTIGYSNSGVPLWTNHYARFAYSGATGIAVDKRGNVFVTGSDNDYDRHSYATVAYSNAGVPLWTNRYDGAPSAGPSDIAVDKEGNVFVTGFSRETNYVYLTIKYSPTIARPRVDFQLLSNELVLSWTNTGCTLQSAPVVTGPFTNIPAATSPYTNSITAPQQFFRLISN